MLFVNWDLGGSAAGQCVTGVGHKVQLPLGPSTRLCLETVRYEPGRNVQPPLGPSTGRLSEKLGFGGVKPSPGRGWLAQRDGCGAVQLTWFRPSSAPVCALGHLPPGEGISPTNSNLRSPGDASSCPGDLSCGFSAIHQNNRYIVHIGAGGAGDDQAAYGL